MKRRRLKTFAWLIASQAWPTSLRSPRSPQHAVEIHRGSLRRKARPIDAGGESPVWVVGIFVVFDDLFGPRRVAGDTSGH